MPPQTLGRGVGVLKIELVVEYFSARLTSTLSLGRNSSPDETSVKIGVTPLISA